MNSILTYMEELNQYDTTDVAPTVHAVEQYNVMREESRISLLRMKKHS